MLPSKEMKLWNASFCCSCVFCLRRVVPEDASTFETRPQMPECTAFKSDAFNLASFIGLEPRAQRLIRLAELLV
ncbi:hypothetical protein CEXT_394571 [Caerostris extrusa]|uniref:Uncharacterized protein n=1 Tax=Caerostris extrusa TaxID=172846 RepID=A0AAV4VL39_CAEEX|nr:hypothetical protein CEXT_394571 [Caerostris extrusa]